MTASKELGHLRIRMTRPYLEYLNESFNLEYASDHRQLTGDLRVSIEREVQRLDARLAALDPRVRDAILAVFTYEVQMLVLRCSLEAEYFVPVRRATRIID